MKETKEPVTKKDLKELEERLSKGIDRNSEKIDSLSESLDRVAIQVLKNTERLEKTATKEDIHRLETGQEKMMTILQRLDQERVFTTERIDRLEKQVAEIKRT